MARFKKPSKYTSLRCHLYKLDPGLADIQFAKVRTLREGIDLLATQLMNVLVFDTDSITLDRLLGKVYLLWAEERRACGKTQYDYDCFAELVRTGVAASLQKALGRELREPTEEEMAYVVEE
jgi:hypothetical protein